MRMCCMHAYIYICVCVCKQVYVYIYNMCVDTYAPFFPELWHPVGGPEICSRMISWEAFGAP